MILYILVADVALLHRAFTRFNSLATRMTMRKDPTAMYCPGCVSQAHELEHLAPDDVEDSRK